MNVAPRNELKSSCRINLRCEELTILNESKRKLQILIDSHRDIGDCNMTEITEDDDVNVGVVV